MNWLRTVLILATAFLVVFFQTTFDTLRILVGAQVDLLPSLMVYVSLTSGLWTIAGVAIAAGLWLDALSANPLGVSMLPLFVLGMILHAYRGLILRDQAFAQVLLGLGASAAVPLSTLLLLLNMERHPLISWFTLWQWLVMSLLGGVMTPYWFRLFEWLSGRLSYRPLGDSSFRADREIKRGRS